MTHLYNIDLNRKWPRLQDYIKATAKGYIVKKSYVFDKEDLDQFFREVCLTNCYQLVRSAVAIITYFGGNRIWEVSKLEVKDFQIEIAIIILKNMLIISG